MSSYESIVRDHHALVYRIALGVLRDRTAAEDVVQEVFLEFLRHPDALERADSTRAFVGRAAVNCALNARRGEARRAKHEQAASPREATMDPIEEVFRREVRSKVAELPEEERLAVDLHYFQGLTLAETAAALDIAHRTASERLREACSKLRKALGAAAFVGLLAGLETELSGCGAEEVPPTLADQLLRLRAGKAKTGRVGGPRSTSIAVSLGVVALVAFLAARGLLALKEGGDSRTGATASDDRTSGLKGGGKEDPRLPVPAVAVIDRDLDLHGIVVTEAGLPLEGALLRTVTNPWRRANLLVPEFSHEDVPGASTQSAADGSFAIRLHLGDVVILRVSAAGFASFGIPMCQAGERLRIVLQPGVRVVARARDEEGVAVAGVRLRLFKRDPEAGRVFDVLGVTDSAGACVLEGVPPSCSALLAADHPGLGGPAWMQVKVPGSGEVGVDVAMVRGRELVGRITDSETGDPIPGARVGMDWVMDAPVVADAEGRYRLPRWTGFNAHSLTADADGYAQESIEVGGSSTLDISLSPGRTVTARLLSHSRVPVANARVSVVAYEHRQGRYVISCRNGVSDQEGRVRLAGLRRDMPHTLIAMADGFGRFLLDFEPLVGPVDLGDVLLPDGRSVDGVVLDPAGKPVPRSVVSLVGFNADRGRLRPDAPPLQLYYGCSESVASDDLGRFRFRDLSPGSYVASVTRKGAPEVKATVTILPDRDVKGVDLRFSDSDGVNVLVLDVGGHPVCGAEVHGLSDDDEAKATTGPDGRARLLLTDPSVTVTVAPGKSYPLPALPSPEQVTSAGLRDLTFVLVEAGSASGQVVMADGSAVAGAEIEIVVGGKRGSRVVADDAGRFKATFPLPGPVDLVLIGTKTMQRKTPGASVAVRSPLQGRLDCVIAGSKDLKLVANPVSFDRSLVVRLETPDGQPAAGVYVMPNLEGAGLKTFESDEKGIARLDGMPSVRVDLLAVSPEHEDWLTVQFEAVCEGQEVLERFRVGAWIEGVVTGPEGRKVKGAQVTARVDGKAVAFCRSTDGGRFRLLVDPAEPHMFDIEGVAPEVALLTGSLKGVRPGGALVTLPLEHR